MRAWTLTTSCAGCVSQPTQKYSNLELTQPCRGQHAWRPSPRGRGEEWDLTLVADPAAGGSSQKVTELLGEWDYCKCIIWTKWFDFKHSPSKAAFTGTSPVTSYSGYLEQVEAVNGWDYFLNYSLYWASILLMSLINLQLQPLHDLFIVRACKT